MIIGLPPSFCHDFAICINWHSLSPVFNMANCQKIGKRLVELQKRLCPLRRALLRYCRFEVGTISAKRQNFFSDYAVRDDMEAITIG